MTNGYRLAVPLGSKYVTQRGRKMPKITIHLMQKLGKTYRQTKILKINDYVDSFKYRNKTFVIDLEKAVVAERGLFFKRQMPELYYDQDNAQPIDWVKPEADRSANDLQTFMASKDYEKMNRTPETEKIYMYLIIIMGICIAVVAIIAIFLMNGNNNRLLDLLNQTRGY